ncbi:Filamentous hemagglutinin [Frankliniella fusca]|uniref:Filamentous hemagglutinin n=1 Tax=Frankliniella fusca TaxID=407009 RepID=A0AAE1LJA0_9NEOP|nr:Filamentous hemagglutinin [Frankliniella fusca]
MEFTVDVAGTIYRFVGFTVDEVVECLNREGLTAVAQATIRPSLLSSSVAPVIPTPTPLIPSVAPVIPSQPLQSSSAAPVIPSQPLQSSSAAPVIPRPTLSSSVAPVIPSQPPLSSSAAPVIPSQPPLSSSAAPVIPSQPLQSSSAAPVIPRPTLSSSVAPVIPRPTLSSSAAPVIPSQPPLSSSAAPVIPSQPPLSSSAAPVIPSQPLQSSSAAPVIPTPTPLISSVAAVIPTPTPLISSVAPVISTKVALADPPGGQSSNSCSQPLTSMFCTVPKNTNADELVHFLNSSLLNLELCDTAVVHDCTLVNHTTANIFVLTNHVNKLLCLDSVVFKGGSIKFEVPVDVPVAKQHDGTSRAMCAADDDVAVEALLKQLILRRGEINFLAKRVIIPKPKMDSILNALKSQGFTCFTSDSITKKRANLVKYYLSRKAMNLTDWRFYNLVAQLMGDQEFNGSFAQVTDCHDRANFSPEATITLIYEYSQRKALFEKALRKGPLWEEVASGVSIAFPQLTNITAATCERKWGSLKTLYYDFKAQVDATGQDSVVLSWPFYEPMQQALQGCRAADPEFTFAVGSSKQMKKKLKKKIVHSSSESEEEVQPKKKRTAKAPKESLAAKKLKLEEKNLEIKSQILAILAGNALKVKKRRSSSTSSNSDA